MSLESSSKYKNDLEQVRNMPEGSKQESQAKKERAKELRMEVMLDSANIADNLTAHLEYNPLVTEKDLEDWVKKFAIHLAHPEVVSTFIKDLKKTHLRVKRGLDFFKSNSQDPEALAKNLYERLILPDKLAYYNSTPNGRIEIDASYPLAAILFIEDKRDFALIDKKENIGGFYRPFLDSNFEFPIIVVKGWLPDHRALSPVKHIEQHEKGHAEHERFASALRTLDKRSIWLPKGRLGVFMTKEKLKDLENSNGKSDPELLGHIMDYALIRAKDELLADFKAVGGIQNHLHNLQRMGGTYDYFKQVGIDINSPLYKVLWEEYNKILEEATKIMYNIMSPYKKLDLDLRLSLMRWVFAQVPLRDFAKQFSKSAFEEEANLLTTILHEYSLPSVYRSKNSTAEKFSVLQRKIYQNQSRSFLPFIREYLAPNS